MKRNVIQVFALIGAISAGGVALADSGYQTGHHELQAQSAGTNSGIMTKGSVGHNGVQHLDRYSDGTLMPKKGNDMHPSVSHSRENFNKDSSRYGPLPSNAGAER